MAPQWNRNRLPPGLPGRGGEIHTHRPAVANVDAAFLADLALARQGRTQARRPGLGHGPGRRLFEGDQDQVESDLELVAVVVAGLQDVLDGQLDEVFGVSNGRLVPAGRIRRCSFEQEVGV